MGSVILILLIFASSSFAEIVVTQNPTSQSHLADLSDSWHHMSPFVSCATQELEVCDRKTIDHFFNAHSRKLKAGRVKRDDSDDDPCTEKLLNYGGRAGDFMRCATNFSRPILYCEKCLEDYLESQEAYRHYAQAKDRTGHLCQDVVYGSDLIQVAQRMNQSIEALWDDSHCSYCYLKYSIRDETIEFEYATGLIQFMQKHRDLMDCFNKSGFVHNGDASWVHDSPISNLTNASLICQNCYPLYRNLSDFFLKNYTQDMTKICMDVVDVMNSTRKLWGRYFQCEIRSPSTFYVWTVVVIVFSTTIVFYIGVFFNSTFEAYVIRRQARLDESRTSGLSHRSIVAKAVPTLLLLMPRSKLL